MVDLFFIKLIVLCDYICCQVKSWMQHNKYTTATSSVS